MESVKKSRYLINGIAFSSKKAVQDYCREIKKRTTMNTEAEWGVRYCLSNDDIAFMLDFIRFDPDYIELVGCGIATIQVGYVGPDVGKPHWGFYLIRIDGSESRFGFRDFNYTPFQKATDRDKDAKRNAIQDQVVEYKEQYFDGQEEAICEATGQRMRRDECHVDHHEPTFKELDQMLFSGWEPDLVYDGNKWQISDEEGIRTAWQEFHRKNAKLRCVTALFNLTRKDAPK